MSGDALRHQSVDAIAVADLFCLYTVPGGATVAALRGITVRVPQHERLVVHGPNGSGKTTLLRVLTGETPVSAGSASVAGIELAGASATRLTALRRDVLGQVDQHSGRTLRPELTVLDNVALQLRLAGRSRPEAAEQARGGLDALGLSRLAERRPSTLSAGEAQRVAVSAAVAHRPAVLLADEPTGELDVAAADSVYDLLSSAAEQVGATLLLVTHDPRAARIADRVVRIRDGRLSEQWHPQQPQDEELVIDDRGWVRLPEPMRRLAGLTERARVQESDGQIVLRPGPGTHVGAAPVAADTAGDRPLPPPAIEAPEPVAQARGVRVAYGERVVLSDFSTVFKAATLTVVRGRSGAGKSTLLRLLLGLSDPDAGEVLLGGRPLAGLARAQRADLRRELVGASLQSGALAEPLDAVENLKLARAARGLAADDDALAAVLSALGLNPVMRRPVRLLSGGERQRVALARALVVQRPVVVLDEPTSHQDEAHAELVTAALLAAASAGAAVISASHDPVLTDAAAELVEMA
jgi:energy-coupling factor transport system ATP-binding protein